MAWIRTIGLGEAEGMLRRIYDAAVRRAGRVFQIVQVMSLSPRALGASLGLYEAVMIEGDELTRRQREMLAVVVSRVNDCHY